MYIIGFVGCMDGSTTPDIPPIEIKGHYVGFQEAKADGIVEGDYWIALPNHNGLTTGVLIEQPPGI